MRTYNLLLCVLVGRQEIDSLHVAKVNVVTKKEDEKQLADVLFLLVPIEGLVALELGPNIGQFLVDSTMRRRPGARSAKIQRRTLHIQEIAALSSNA